MVLFDSVIRRDLIVSHKSTVNPFSFPKLPGPGSPMRAFPAFLVFLLLFLLIFHFYCLLSHPYTLFSLFLYWRMSCPLTVQTNLLCWGSLLRQGPIFNQMFCKQKAYSFSRTLLTRTFLWFSLLSDFISTGVAVSPKRVQTAHGLHSTAVLLLPSFLSLDTGSAKILSMRMGGVVTNYATWCNDLISCRYTNTFSHQCLYRALLLLLTAAVS